jgi:dolichol kinase
VRDGALALLWLVVLGGGLGACAVLARLGVPRTHVRDVLHVGAGVWVLGWPAWTRPAVPVVITALALAGVLLLPVLARRAAWAARAQSVVAGGEEQWSGIALYVLSFFALTAVGLWGRPFPAAAALLALALGDGVGGAVGLRWGRHRFRVPWAKTKSVEGTVVVSLMAAVGVWLAALLFDVHVGAGRLVLTGLVAAAVEAASPRASDNVLLPAAVWALLVL